MLFSAETYRLRRRQLAAQLLPAAVAVLVTNEVMPSNTDGTLPYLPSTNLLYLSGLAQPQTADKPSWPYRRSAAG